MKKRKRAQAEWQGSLWSGLSYHRAAHVPNWPLITTLLKSVYMRWTSTPWPNTVWSTSEHTEQKSKQTNNAFTQSKQPKKAHWSHPLTEALSLRPSLCPTQYPHSLSGEQAGQPFPKCLKVPVSHNQVWESSPVNRRGLATERKVGGKETKLALKGLCNTDHAPQFQKISVPGRTSCQTWAWNQSTILPSQPFALPQQHTVHMHYGSIMTENSCPHASLVPKCPGTDSSKRITKQKESTGKEKEIKSPSQRRKLMLSKYSSNASLPGYKENRE